MALKLNKTAFNHAKELVNEGMLVSDERDAWSNTNLQHTKKTNSFACMASKNTESGIWESMMNKAKTQNADIGFRMAISRMCIDARCYQQKAGPDNTNTSILRMPPLICTE